MKRFVALCLSIVFAASIQAGCGSGQTAARDIDAIEDYRDIPNVTEEEISAIEKLKQEKGWFSYGHLLETESFVLPDGTFAGFTIELCKLLTGLFGADFVPEYFEERDGLLDGLSGQTLDFTGCAVSYGERGTRLISSSPIGGRGFSIYTSIHTPEISTGADLSGMTVAFISGTNTKKLVAGSYSLPTVASVDVQNISEAAEMLRSGGIDALIVDSAMDPQFERFNYLRSKSLYWPVFTQIAISTGNSELSPVITVINKYLEAGGFSRISALYDRGMIEYEKNKLIKSFTREENAYLQDLITRDAAVNIALEHDNYPFSFYNSQSGEFEGMAVDVLNEVSRLTGIRFVNTTTETTSWTEILEKVKSGEVSLVSHLVYSDERAKSYIWSNVPFSVDTYSLISKSDFPQVKSYEIPTLKTGAFKNSIYAEIYTQWFPDSTNLVLYDTASDSFDALERGEIDLVIGADFMLLAQTNYREKSGYVVNYRFDASLSSAFGLNQNETVLRSIIDKSLSQIALEPISNYWNGRVFDYTSKMERQKTTYVTAIAVLLFFGLAAMSFLFFKNKRLTESLRVRTVTLSEARQSLQTILDTVPLSIGILDKETRNIVYGNNVFIDIMELNSPSDLYNLNSKDIFEPILVNGNTALDLKMLLTDTESQVIGKIRLKTANKRAIDVRMHVRWSDYYGRRCAIAIMVDLTAEKEYQQMLLAAAEHEKEANQAKSMFLANMSHEIRTPMNGIIGLTDLLLNEDISGRQLQYVKDIKTSSESLLGIINDILDISKVSAGKLEIEPVDTELSVLLDNVVSMIGFSARVKGLGFIKDIRVEPPLYVKLDDVRVRQIITNLLSNAVKFTNEGHIRLTVQIEDGSILFSVSDTGIGIKPEDIKTIFGAFDQVDTLRNRRIHGTGLGLSITKSLVELMGGDIRVKSEYGIGTIFTVSIPFVPGDETNTERVEKEIAYPYAPDVRVLLVDDIQINLTVGAGLLRLCGITPIAALSGAEAIELVKEQDFDLILMDHMMPDMDGVEATERIRALGEKYRKIPVVALTANAMIESRDLLLRSGLNDFISKPIEVSVFMSVLRKWLPPEKILESGNTSASVRPEAYTEMIDAAARIKGLDIERALSRLGGLQDVLEASIRQSARSIDGKLRSMDVSLHGSKLVDFALEAHGLKGMLASIGATHDSELAAQLESAAKAGDLHLCIEKFPDFVSELESLSIELNALINKTDGKEKPTGDTGLLALKISEAIRLLEDFEAIDAAECLRELDKYSYGDDASRVLRDALAMVEAFDYENAIETLDRLRSSNTDRRDTQTAAII